MEFSLFQLPTLKDIQIPLALIFVLLASLLIPRFYKAFRKLDRKLDHLWQIPGPSGIFVIRYFMKMAREGTIKTGSFNLLFTLSRLFPKSGIVRISFGHKQVVIPCNPEVAEVILTREESLERPAELSFFPPLIVGKTMTTASPFQEWRKRRKMLNPAFHIRVIERYLQVFNKHAAIFVDKAKQRDSSQSIDLLPNMQSCALDIICEAAMGVDIESQKGRNAEFVDACHIITNICMQRIFQPWLYPDIIFNFLPIGRRLQKNLEIFYQTGRKIIAQRKERMLSDPTKKKQIKERFLECVRQMQVPFIDLLLYYHLYGEEKLTEEDILGEVNTFIFGGFDTCSITLSWALYLIGNDARVQRAIHDELDTVLSDDRDRPISVDDTKNLKYLNCVFKETLRLYSPASVVFRCTHKDLQLNGYTVPAGTICLVFIDVLHRDPRYFSKPDCFLPERFLNYEDRHPFAYIPFAAGPKNCIGQKFAHFEVMTLLASILRNFMVKSTTPMDKVRRGLQIATVPLDSLNVYLTPRSS